MIGLITLAAGAASPEGKAHLLGLDAEGWVYVAITLFFVLAIFGAKGHRILTKGLDDRVSEVRKALDEAAAIRAEAEALLARAKEKHAASAAEAVALLHHARQEAKALIARAESDTSEIIARREKLAAEKIATAERAAIEAIRARAANAAIGTAKDLIVTHHAAAADGALIDEAIAAL